MGVSDGNLEVVIWKDGSDQTIKARTRNATMGGWNAVTQLLAATVSDVSLGPRSIQDDQYWYICWIEDGNLWYGKVNSSPLPVLSGAQIIAAGSADVENLNPSVANLFLTTGRVAVAWEEYKWEIQKRVIKYKEKSRTGPWSNTYVWAGSASSQYYTPSLTGHVADTDITIVWRRTGNLLRYVQRVESLWGAQMSLGSGTEPTASIGFSWTTPSSEVVLHRGGSAAPYPIQQSVVSYTPTSMKQGGKPTSFNMSMPGRGGNVILENGMLSLIVLRATIESEQIQFVALNDTIPIRNTSDFRNALLSEPFIGFGTLELDVLYSASGIVPSGTLFRAVVQDATSGQILREVIPLSGQRDTSFTVSVPLSYRDRSVQVALEPLPGQKVEGFEVEHWFVMEDDSTEVLSLNPQAHSATGDDGGIPKTYAFYGNYPNPFNPSTTLSFDLPEGSDVTLIVYDLLGREVARLVEDHRVAGRHTARWSPVEESSGLYFARINVVGLSGEEKLAKTVKLVYVK